MTIIPKDDFLAQIKDQNRVISFLTLGAIMLAIWVGIFMALQVSRPIARLSAAAMSFAWGNWPQPIPNTRIREIQQLGQSFTTMAAQLHEALNHLEEGVRTRTAELATSEARYRGIVEDQPSLSVVFCPTTTP